jgi:hypothetical protein
MIDGSLCENTSAGTFYHICEKARPVFYSLKAKRDANEKSFRSTVSNLLATDSPSKDSRDWPDKKSQMPPTKTKCREGIPNELDWQVSSVRFDLAGFRLDVHP